MRSCPRAWRRDRGCACGSGAWQRASPSVPLRRTFHPAHLRAHRVEGIAPDIGPRQSGEQQHQREARDPEAGDGMQVAQQRATTRPQHAGRTATAWPPQIKAGDQHHDGPAGGQFHQPAAARCPAAAVPWMRRATSTIRVPVSRLPSTAPCGETNTSRIAPARAVPDGPVAASSAVLGQPVAVEAGAGKGGKRRFDLTGWVMRLCVTGSPGMRALPSARSAA